MHGSHSSLSHFIPVNNNDNHQPLTQTFDHNRASIRSNPYPMQYETRDGDVFIIGNSFYQRRVEKNQGESSNYAMANGHNGGAHYANQHGEEGDELNTELPDDVTLSEQRVEELESLVTRLRQEIAHLREINEHNVTLDRQQDPAGFFDEQDFDEVRTITRYRPELYDKSTGCSLEEEHYMQEEKTSHNFHRIDLERAIDQSQFPPHYWSRLEKHFTKKLPTRNIGFQSRQVGIRTVEVMAKPTTRSFNMVVRIPSRDNFAQSDEPDTLGTIRNWVDLNYGSVYNDEQRHIIAQLLHTLPSSREEFIEKVSPYITSVRDPTSTSLIEKHTSTDFSVFHRSQSTCTSVVLPNASSTGIQTDSLSHMVDRSVSTLLNAAKRVTRAVQTSMTRLDVHVAPSPVKSKALPTMPPHSPTLLRANELLAKDLRDKIEKATVNESTTKTAHLVPSRSLTPDEVRQLFGSSQSSTVDVRTTPYSAHDVKTQAQSPQDDFSITTERRVVHEQSNQFLLPGDLEFNRLQQGIFPIEDQILARSQPLGRTAVTREYGPNVGVQIHPSTQSTPTGIPVSTTQQTFVRDSQVSCEFIPASESESQTFSTFASSSQSAGSEHVDGSRGISKHTVQQSRDSYQGSNMPIEVANACERLAAHYQLGQSTIQNKQMSDQLSKIRCVWFDLTSSASDSNFEAIRQFVTTLKSYHENLLRDVIQSTDVQGSSTLHLAIGHGAWSVVSLILDSGHAQPDRFNSAGYTPIMVAALSKFSSPSVVNPLQRLFKLGNVNLHANTRAKPTALILAAQNGLADVVQLLLQHGANPNLQDAAGNTAVMFAVENGHSEVVNLLLNCPNLDLSLRDNLGKDVLAIAVRRNDMAIVERIVGVLNRHKQN